MMNAYSSVTCVDASRRVAGCRERKRNCDKCPSSRLIQKPSMLVSTLSRSLNWT